MQSKRVLFLASGLDEASCRFRFGQYLPHLRARGIECVSIDLAVPAALRRAIWKSARDYDQVFVHRALLRLPDWIALRRYARRYVFDFDDAIMMRDSSRRKQRSWQRRLRFALMTRGAQRVIAGNDYLAAWAAPYNRRVAVIPTTIELADYPPLSSAKDEKDELIIGWIGTRANLMYLRTIVPALSRIAQKFPRVKLKIVADDFLDVPGMEVIRKPWALADEVADVGSFDIGIMPLPDDAWTRGKCALKILQGFAASVPVVCSPVGANRDVMNHDVEGYFAQSQDEWVARLEELLLDSQKRRRMGQAGRRAIEEKYSVAANVEQFAQTLIS